MSARWAWAPLVASAMTMAQPAGAETLDEPPVLRSVGGLLDVLIVARENRRNILGLSGPVGWVYDICPNPGPAIDRCAPGPLRSDAFGGTRLALQPGDQLRMRLVNKLPKFQPGEAKHAEEPGREDLVLNPTNIHTHGLIVEARFPTVARPTWGDNVFVLAYNPANGVPQPFLTGSHVHGGVTGAPVQYEIDIPRNHPSGSYWFHPHAHGIALNQVTSGLSGLITIGGAADYACEDWSCGRRWSEANVRNIMLKDTQVDGVATTAPKILTQQTPDFCTDLTGSQSPAGKGYCDGQRSADAIPADPTTTPPTPAQDAVDHTGGKWIFTLNGQVYPTVPVSSATGEIWRLTNSSASVSYDLHLYDDANQRDMIMQLVSIDGVSVSANDIVSNGQAAQVGGAKFTAVDCPPAPTALPATVAAPLCVTSIKMYPSSRVEIWVTWRGPDNRPTAAPKGARATFKTVGLQTGDAGDSWPAVDLGEVRFTQGPRPAGMPEHVTIDGTVRKSFAAGGIFATPALATASATNPYPSSLPCTPVQLPAGYKRRIYYGVPAGTADGFGLAYEIVDQNGDPVDPASSPTTVTTFDPSQAVVCLNLGPGNTPIKETWELVNLAGEDHNFHIHQTKFRVVDASSMTKSGRRAPLMLGRRIAARYSGLRPLPAGLPFPKGTVLHDNIPLPAGTALDATGCAGIAEWKAGSCEASVLTVEIAFSQLGDFVYHCHILEHEDGGMMARIAVKPGQ